MTAITYKASRIPRQEKSARMEIARAVKKLLATYENVKRNYCEQCGATGTVIHGHRWDYNKPLSLDWLCGSCHTTWHAHLQPIRLRPEYYDFCWQEFYALGLAHLEAFGIRLVPRTRRSAQIHRREMQYLLLDRTVLIDRNTHGDVHQNRFKTFMSRMGRLAQES